MGVYIRGMEIPKSCKECVFKSVTGVDRWKCRVLDTEFMSWDTGWGGEETRREDCPLVPILPHGRLVDADTIGLTNFEIILCKQEHEPYKEALKMILDRIEKSPTIIPEDRRDSEE